MTALKDLAYQQKEEIDLTLMSRNRAHKRTSSIPIVSQKSMEESQVPPIETPLKLSQTTAKKAPRRKRTSRLKLAKEKMANEEKSVCINTSNIESESID